jgi:PAS domain S-box-containing protein
VTIVSDSARFTRTLRSAIVWPVGIIFATALVLLFFIFQLLQVVKLSDHSYKVLTQTRTCENLVVSTQNDVRGYLLTGNKDFIKAYDESRSQIDAEFERLKDLVKDNPEQSIRAEALIQTKENWLAHSKTMVAHRAQDVPTNPDWVLMGKTLMDDIEAKFDKITDVEETLSADRQQRVTHMKRALAYGGGGLVLLLLVTIAYVVRKQMMALAADYRGALDTIAQRHGALARSEADLESQKEWLRVTLTSIGDGVIVADPTGRVVLINREAERLTGWTNVDALHQPLASVLRIVDETTRAPHADIVGPVLREKRVVAMRDHSLLLSRTGETWPIDDSAAPICDAHGTVMGVVIVFHDATQKRNAALAQKAYSADLERKVADRTTALQQTISELEAFSYTVSHDLRSPLRAMQGFAEAVLEDYGDKLGEEGKNYLERIRNAGERLDKLIQDLLAYTRISREETPLEAIDLDAVFRDIVERDPVLNGLPAMVTIEGKLPRVYGRETAIVQVVSNLLGNAAKFIPRGTTPQIRVRAEERGDRVRVWIEDNGIGIAERDQQRIFQMFVQVNDARVYGGTGVGLAIVRKAVQTMRGSVGVESIEGAGSRFWFELNKAPQN